MDVCVVHHGAQRRSVGKRRRSLAGAVDIVLVRHEAACHTARISLQFRIEVLDRFHEFGIAHPPVDNDALPRLVAHFRHAPLVIDARFRALPLERVVFENSRSIIAHRTAAPVGADGPVHRTIVEAPIDPVGHVTRSTSAVDQAECAGERRADMHQTPSCEILSAEAEIAQHSLASQALVWSRHGSERLRQLLAIHTRAESALFLPCSESVQIGLILANVAFHATEPAGSVGSRRVVFKVQRERSVLSPPNRNAAAVADIVVTKGTSAVLQCKLLDIIVGDDVDNIQAGR
mmetsp:Transcript_16715/g.41114  ORF Transcript_16715/g.41114 Transcript_16715/m.41114 type:complete len:290 (+) Transcript_16715:514-1383(+)